MDIGLLLLRLAIGSTIAAHGAQMLFGWFGGEGLEKTGQLFVMFGFQSGRRYALTARTSRNRRRYSSGLRIRHTFSGGNYLRCDDRCCFSRTFETRLLHHEWRLRVYICSVCRSLNGCVYRSWRAISGRNTWSLVEWWIVG